MPTWRSTSVPTLRVSRPHRTAYRVVDEARRRGRNSGTAPGRRQGESCRGHPDDGGGRRSSRGGSSPPLPLPLKR